MDKHYLISVFVAVVDVNGFAGAARKLNVSPPVVTGAINELEETLGVDQAFSNNRDPLSGCEPEAEFRALFTRIVNAVPAPIGPGQAA